MKETDLQSFWANCLWNSEDRKWKKKVQHTPPDIPHNVQNKQTGPQKETKTFVLILRSTVNSLWEAYRRWGCPGDISGKEPAYQCRRHETQVRFLGQEDPLEDSVATHSGILSWRSGGQRSLQSMGSQRTRPHWCDLALMHTYTEDDELQGKSFKRGWPLNFFN